MCTNCGHLCSFEDLVFDRGLSNLGRFDSRVRAVGRFHRPHEKLADRAVLRDSQRVHFVQISTRRSLYNRWQITRLRSAFGQYDRTQLVTVPLGFSSFTHEAEFRS